MQADLGEVIAQRFEVISHLGGGSLGEVFLVADREQNNALAAIKVIAPQLISDPAVRKRLRDEVGATANLSHPNVVSTVGLVEAADTTVLVLEYVEGGDLGTLMESGKFAPEETLTIVSELAIAIEFLHQQGIIHRDIKPSNIFLSHEGEVKLGDSGLARLGGETTISRPGCLLGTARYISPEYIETGDCDARADIYAIGVIAYELINGLTPRSSSSDTKAAGVLPLVQAGAKFSPDCPEGLAAVIQKAMAFNVSDRYQTATELKEALLNLKMRNSEQLSTEKDDLEPPRALILSSSVFMVCIILYTTCLLLLLMVWPVQQF